MKKYKKIKIKKWYNEKGDRVDKCGRPTHKRGVNNPDRPSKQKWANVRHGRGLYWWDKRLNAWCGEDAERWNAWQGWGASSSGGAGRGGSGSGGIARWSGAEPRQ